MRQIASRIHLVCLSLIAPLAVFSSSSAGLVWTQGLGIFVWLIYLAGVLLGFPVMPQARTAKTALLGLLGLTAFTAASISWAPDQGSALGNLTQLLFYSGSAFAFTSGLSRFDRSRLVEPLAWATAAAASAYGISERLLPGLISLQHDQIAFGRLSQPLGYWNAMGALAGIGLVLAARLAADRGRPTVLRYAAIASTPLLGAVLWLTFSRGALVATAAGLLTIAALRLSPTQIRSALITATSLIPVAIAEESLNGVRTLGGSMASRQSDGLGLLVVIVATGLIAVAAQHWWNGPSRSSDETFGRYAKGLTALLAVVLALVPVATVILGSGDASPPVTPTGANAQRLQSVSTNRSEYWSVALTNGFKASPIQGHGSAAFRALWLQHRNGLQPALNAHSLEVEIAAELGLVGLVFLMMLLAGTCLKARSLHLQRPQALVGAMGAGVVFLSHSSVDWDFQVPGVTVLALLLMSGVLAQPDTATERGPRASGYAFTAAGLLSVTACVWLGHLWEAQTLQAEARAKINAAEVLGWSPDRYHDTVSLLKEASWLNPNPGPKIDLADVYWRTDHPRLAIKTVRALIKDNPRWWLGWQILYSYRSQIPLIDALEARTKAELYRGFGPASGS